MLEMPTILRTLLAQPESTSLDFMISAAPDKVARTVTALLNTNGGTLVIGASESGEFVGVPDARQQRNELEHFLLTNIAPEITLSVEVTGENRREGILIEVPPGSAKPYVFAGAIYVRRDAATVAASPAEITRLVNRRQHEDERWECLAAIGIEPNSLNLVELDATVEAARRRYMFSPEVDASPAMKLERLGLIADGWPSNAAIVLFLNETTRRYPNLAARATVFQDEERRTFTDDQLFEGNALSLFQRLFEFIGRHTSIRSNLETDSTIRTDRPALPILVAREALLNAVIHRDYSDVSPIQLRLFPSRLELWNPGSIMQDIIDQPGVSRPRNPDTARIMYLRGYAELLGVGMLRMRDVMASLGRPAPQWENRAGGTQLTISLTDEPVLTMNSAADWAQARALGERAVAYLNASKPSDRITRESYQALYDLKERSARKDLQRLVEFGYLRPVGAASRTAYVRTQRAAPQG